MISGTGLPSLMLGKRGTHVLIATANLALLGVPPLVESVEILRSRRSVCTLNVNVTTEDDGFGLYEGLEPKQDVPSVERAPGLGIHFTFYLTRAEIY